MLLQFFLVSFLKTKLKMLFNRIKRVSQDSNHTRKKQLMDNLVKRLYLLYCPNCYGHPIESALLLFFLQYVPHITAPTCYLHI